MQDNALFPATYTVLAFLPPNCFSIKSLRLKASSHPVWFCSPFKLAQIASECEKSSAFGVLLTLGTGCRLQRQCILRMVWEMCMERAFCAVCSAVNWSWAKFCVSFTLPVRAYTGLRIICPPWYVQADHQVAILKGGWFSCFPYPSVSSTFFAPGSWVADQRMSSMYAWWGMEVYPLLCTTSENTSCINLQAKSLFLYFYLLWLAKLEISLQIMEPFHINTLVKIFLLNFTGSYEAQLLVHIL